MFASQMSVKSFIWLLKDCPINEQIFKVIEETAFLSGNYPWIQFRDYVGNESKMDAIIQRLGNNYHYACVGDTIIDWMYEQEFVEFWLHTNTIIQWMSMNGERFDRLRYHAVIDTHLDNGMSPQYFNQLNQRYFILPKEYVGCTYTERCFNFDKENETHEFLDNLLRGDRPYSESSMTTFTPTLKRILHVGDKPLWIKQYPQCAMIRKNVVLDNEGNVYGCLKKRNIIGKITDDFMSLKESVDRDIRNNRPSKCSLCKNRLFCGSCAYSVNQTMCDQMETCFNIIEECGKLTTPIEL